MKALIITTIISGFFTVTAHAAIYKCVIDGETVFSERPCASNAKEVQIRVHRPDQSVLQESTERANSIAEHERVLREDRRRREVQREIDELESRIRIAQRNMDAEHAALRARKSKAANNLAGATLEHGIAEEMQAVTAKYQARIDAAQARLKQLYAEQSKAGQ